MQQQRVLTHEMYAAGHPPLRGFELATFAETMPPHWRTFAEKPRDVRSQFLNIMREKRNNNKAINALLIDYQQDDFVRTKAMLIGALVSLAEHLRLTVQLIEKEGDDAGTAWPELSQFDCFACHHALKHPGWRQSLTSRVGAPGRPLVHAWTLALAEVAIKTANELGIAEAKTNQLHDVLLAVRARPFGDTAKLEKTAVSASSWLTAVARDLEQHSLGNQEVGRIRDEVRGLFSNKDTDPYSMLQYRRALKVILAELNKASREL